MSWITAIWCMVASACLVLAAMHLLVWCGKRTAWASLLFALTAVGTASLAFCELWVMRAGTVEEYGTVIRWGHVPFWVLIVSLVCFVRLYMRAGRLWLAWTACGVRTLSVVLDFVFSPNLNYREITALRQVRFLGESVSVVEGIPNPWMLVGQTSLLLFVVFLTDATLTIWRRGERRSLLILSSAMLIFVVASTGQFVYVFWGGTGSPLTPSLFFMGVVAAMAWEMSREMTRAIQLADDLRESEARMSLAAEATGVGVWMWSIARNQVWGSERWRRLFAFVPDETVTFEMVVQRIHADDCEEVERGVRGALADLSDYAGDYRVALPDGSQRWVAARGKVYPDANGKPARMLGTAIDITDRKRTALALAESELRYRTLFESAPEGILLIGADGNIRAANPAQARLYGYESPEQLEGLYAPLCVAEKDRERARQTMRDLLEGEERSARRYTAVRRDGAEFIAEVTSAVLRGPGREVQGYLCLTRDITESQRMESALRESEQRFLDVAEAAGRFIWEVDAEGLYTYASPSAERMLGYTPEDLVGKKHFYDLFVPSVREELKAAAFQVFADRQTFRDFPNANVSKSGEVVHLETGGTPVLDEAGDLVGYRGVDADVTERKRVEAEIQRQRNELAHVARVSAMGQLASSLAHELNQPLGAILRNAEAAELFLQDPSPDLDELRAILADIRKDDHRAGEVIDRMRAMMKRREFERRRLDLGVLVDEVGALVRADAERRRVRLAMETDAALPPVQGDRVQLQQVLLIFLSGHGDVPTTVQAMRRGAEDFLTKLAPKEELLEAVRRALDRDAHQRVEHARLEALHGRFAALTPRELEVLKHVVQGRLNKQIAGELGIHERTVKLHRTAITTKLGVHSAAELTRLWMDFAGPEA